MLPSLVTFLALLDFFESLHAFFSDIQVVKETGTINR
jgi:hypothetical protein